MSDLWLWVIIAGLANYKAAHMLSQDGDDGPFDLFKKLRDKAGTEIWYGKGLHCFSCVSFWGALIASLLLWPTVPVNHFLLIWGAVATVAYMVWRFFG
jgi:hypothetical protein